MLNENTGFQPQLGFKPFNQNVNPNGLNVGYLVYFQEQKKLMFQDATMKLHPIDRVSFLTSEWNIESGSKNLPKPYILDKDSSVLEYGDNLLYGYVSGTTDNIAVMGSLMRLAFGNYRDSLATDPTNLDNLQEKNTTRSNKLRYFTFEEDGQGNVIIALEGKKGEKKGKANLMVKVKGAENDGVVSFESDSKIAFTVIQTNDKTEKVTAQLLFDSTKDKESITIKDFLKNTITINKDGIKIESEKNIDLTVKGEIKLTAEKDLTATVKNLVVTASGDATISAKKAKITGGQLEVGGSATPNGQGAFCGVPNCIFSGAPHVSNLIMGT